MAQIEIVPDQVVISGAEYRRLLAVDYGLKHRTVGDDGLRSLLREARQYVSDAGLDEYSETQTHSAALLKKIDAALAE